MKIRLSPSTVQETVTVTAEAPLLEVTTSSLGGNIDPRQLQELPVNGRNWMQLAVLAPGSRTNAVNVTTPLPDRNDGEAREFQLNVDGQQVSTDIGTGNQARYSQETIGKFQFLSNRFDATQGRSSGVQVNVITKSGTNALSGLLRGNFRDDSFNAQNPVLHRVVPFNNQQISTAGGGPLVRDRVHYFGNFEYEREPRLKAVIMASGSLNIGQDLFHYYPPIQERVRWIIGARDLQDAARKLRDYTTEGVAQKIQCPMVIGYGSDDRIMDPQGAYRLYQAAVNSKREMMAGLGHPHHAAKAGGPRAERPQTLQDWLMRQLHADVQRS